MATINLYLALLVSLWFPLNKTILKYLVAFWVITWVLQGNHKSKWHQLKTFTKEHKLLYLPFIFYIINALGFLYSYNKSSALHDLEVKLSLLIFPLIFISIGHLYKKHIIQFFNFFLIGNLIASVICLVVALLNSMGVNHGEMLFETAINQNYSNQSFFLLVGNRQSLFSYTYLSIFHHPGYFSMYLVFAVIVAYYQYRLAVKKRWKTIYLSLLVFFYIMIYLLSTRAGLISLSATLISLTIIEFTKSKHYALVFLVSFTLNYGLYKAITVSKLKKNVEELKEITTQPTDPTIKGQDKIKHRDTRFIIWKSALQIIKRNVWFGVGTGDTRKALIEEFRKEKFRKGINSGFNSHNQYFEIFLSGGILSFFTLMAMLIVSFIYSLKNNRLILSFLICLVAFNFLFESMLETMAGVIFFSFFYCLLVAFSPPPLIKNK